ncbi:unnamed protein product [Prunus armeniaca]|uniref:Uncharacterized protein n=1 Tax=Prunus armeniaca TaxID=36596 RepID=A0A6J5X9L0_PRUAR|nr:unnamed protein product [Prunus armeniaca]CAB4310646.1 unnamed protein product [Prunus armeniaca]
MARKSGILIRHLFGNWSNPCAGLLHHRRKLLPSSIQTLTLSSFYGLTPRLPSPCKLPVSSPILHFMGHSDKGLVFSRPQKMVIISNKDDYDKAIKQVTDGLLPAVFYFIDHKCIPDSSYEPALLLRGLRMKFPHVTIYKIIKPPVVDMEEILGNMVPDYRPTFHCFQNGEKVFEVDLYELRIAFEQLYSHVIPVGTTQPTGSSGMEERRAEQLVIQAEKEENDKEVAGGFKVGSGRALSQRKGAATLSQRRGGLVEAVESSTAPSLHDVMQAVESLPGGRSDGLLWWYARGLFKGQPKKRVMFSNMQGLYFKVAWLLREIAKE